MGCGVSDVFCFTCVLLSRIVLRICFDRYYYLAAQLVAAFYTQRTTFRMIHGHSCLSFPPSELYMPSLIAQGKFSSPTARRFFTEFCLLRVDFSCRLVFLHFLLPERVSHSSHSSHSN